MGTRANNANLTNREKGTDPLTTNRLKEMLEFGGKALIGLAGLCYVLGLLVVTMHLRSYGLNSLSLSQLYYVTAGVWVLLPSLVVMCFFAFAGFVIRAQEWKQTKPEEPTWPKYFAVGALLLTILMGFYFVGEYLLRAFGIQLTFFSWLVIPTLGAIAFAAIAAAIWIVMTGGAASESTNQKVVVATVFGGIAVALSMFHIALFARNTYRDIPWSTGGGRPSQVELVIETEAKPYLESVGIKFLPTQNRTESVKLLLVTEHEYVLLNPDGKAVGVPSDAVRSVLYEK